MEGIIILSVLMVAGIVMLIYGNIEDKKRRTAQG
jgi:hypothetical protein